MKVQALSAITLAIALCGNAAPLWANQPLKTAQLLRQNSVLPAGQEIEVKLNSTETLYISTGERKAAELIVEQDVVADNGIVLIPEGAVITGEFVPVSGGSKFVARSLTSRGGTVRIAAESELINDVKDPRETGVAGIAGDAAIGAAAGAILGGIFGDRVISTEKILGGAAAGVLVGNVTAPQVVVIDPATPLTIFTRRSITFRNPDRF